MLIGQVASHGSSLNGTTVFTVSCMLAEKLVPKKNNLMQYYVQMAKSKSKSRNKITKSI